MKVIKSNCLETLLTTKEAAKILGVSAARVRQWIGEDRLKAEKFGRDHLIDTTEIERFKKIPAQIIDNSGKLE